jgi:hypothetical protein
MNRFNRSDKPDWVPPRTVKLLDQVCERVRWLRYSLQTVKAYVYWAKAFVWCVKPAALLYRQLFTSYTRYSILG